MQVMHALPAITAGIEHYAITACIYAQLLGNTSCGRQHVAQQGIVLSAGLSQRNQVLAWNDQDVHRRLRLQIGKGQHIRIRMQKLCA